MFQLRKAAIQQSHCPISGLVSVALSASLLRKDCGAPAGEHEGASLARVVKTVTLGIDISSQPRPLCGKRAKESEVVVDSIVQRRT